MRLNTNDSALQADAVEPTTDGPNKFVLSSKGHKHTFKAATQAERDNWVAQLKLKIAEAKELSKTITESEKYKSTIASFAPAKKEEKVEKVEDKKVEETPKAVEETPAAEAEAAPAVDAVTAEETPKDEPAKEEAKDTKADEGKRSASRKRTSIFGALLGGNKEKKAEEKKEETVPETPAAVVTTEETPVATTEAPTEAAKEEEAIKEPEVAATEPTAAAESSETKAKAVERPTASKRTRYVATNLSAESCKRDTDCLAASSERCLLARRRLRRPPLPSRPRTPRSLR